MSSPGTGTAILFQDDVTANGQQRDPATLDYNRWHPADNPSFLGLAKLGQSLPLQERGWHVTRFVPAVLGRPGDRGGNR
jgi:hypothetical protein